MAVYVVQLQDDVSAPAKKAGDAVGSLAAQFEALQGQLSAVEKMQKNAFAFHDKGAFKAPTESNVLDDIRRQQMDTLGAYALAAEAAYGREKAAIDQVAASGRALNAERDKEAAQIKALQQKNLAGHDQNRDVAAGLGEQHKQNAADQLAGKDQASVSKWFADLQAQSKGADDALLGFQTQLIGIVQKAAPVIAVLAAIAVGLGKLAMMAISATQVKDALRETLGPETLNMVEALSQKLPNTVDELGAWAKSLQVAGYQGARLQTAIEAVAASAAKMKDGGAAADALLKRMAALAETGGKLKLDAKFEKQLFAAGINLGDVAKAMGVSVEKLKTMSLSAEEAGDAIQKALITKGQGALQQLGQTSSVIWAKIQEGTGDAFEDLGDLVHPFMAEIQSLASEFFKGSIASQGLAGVVKSVLTPVFQFATQAVHWLHLAFLTLEAYVLRARIALLPVSNILAKVGFGAAAVNVGLYLLKGTVITLAIVFGLLAIGVLLCALPFIVIAVAIYAVVMAVEYLIDNIDAGMEYLWSLGMAGKQAGSDLINGLGNAIASGTAWVVGLITDLAASIIGAIVGPLQIHSPSRVMQRLGGHITTGLAEGVEAGTPDVAMAAAGAGGAAVTGAAGGAAKGGGGITVKVEAGAVVLNGVGADVAGMLEEGLALLVERVLLQAGAKA